MSSERDQLGQRARGRGGDLAVGLAQLGLDVGEAEALVDLGLGRVARDLPGARVGDPVLGDREPHRRRRARAARCCARPTR